ncbi:MAG TPA: D-glycerate dehydrogenase [Nitrolancea sp.]|nr:D-glycerate dehydrogenase [Nitrolancea sp.]
MLVAVTREIPDVGLRLLRDFCEVVVWPDKLPPTTAQLIEFAHGADGLLSLLTEPINGPVLDQLPTIRVVSNFAVGYDNIDVASCTERGVAVCTTPDVLTDTTADFAFALLLATARRVVESAASVPLGGWRTWEPLGYLGKDVAGATLGIIGLGRIGAAVVRRAAGFNMRVLYSDDVVRSDAEQELGVERVDFETLIRLSDFVSLHVPLTPDTYHMIGRPQLQSMKSSAVLVNTSRGPVVDNDALADALVNGVIWGAALDVTDPEPLPSDHRLARLSNCIVTPHIASATEATRSKMSEMAAINLISVLSGKQPLRCLNTEVLSDV